mmetsp:Transcript_6412/g.16001  ORF Transcript_6412/g.16001 Transcript_6412/m.16001 type:complete len:185 (+) Transcript_6412:151-705(+)
MSHDSATSPRQLGFWRHVYSRDVELRELSRTLPPNVWPHRELKVKEGSNTLDHYFARGWPHDRNNISPTVSSAVAPDPNAPFWPPPGKHPSAQATPRNAHAAAAATWGPGFHTAGRNSATATTVLASAEGAAATPRSSSLPAAGAPSGIPKAHMAFSGSSARTPRSVMAVASNLAYGSGAGRFR